MLKRSLVFAWALLVGGCAGSGSIDGGGADHGARAVEAPAEITFGADWSETTSRDLHAGDAVAIRYDVSRLSCTGSSQGGIPQWSVTGHASVDGRPDVAFAVAGLNAPADALPTIAVDEPGNLRLWFESSDRWGCHAYDSDYGSDYLFDVSMPPDGPGWIGNDAFVISRAACDGGACDADRKPLAQGFSYDTWARQRAAIAGVYFDVWQEGVTDWDDPDLWRELDVEVHYRFADADPFTTAYVDFDERVNHDARYAWPLHGVDPFAAPGCPDVPMTPTSDGQYVTTTMQFYFTVNGVALRPWGADTYSGQFVDYRSRLDACSGG
ncbi:MAG TPA: DUF6209 family protein [Minicystis sp.]|nr:DUF6209 family protein [Minicystis sp.]